MSKCLQKKGRKISDITPLGTRVGRRKGDQKIREEINEIKTRKRRGKIDKTNS
jgi:hypothetical protein